MTDISDVRDRYQFYSLRKVMGKSRTLDEFGTKLGTEPTATQARLFMEYKSLVGQQRLEDRFVGDRYLTGTDFERVKELGLRISSFVRNGKNVRILRNKLGRFVSSRSLDRSLPHK